MPLPGNWLNFYLCVNMVSSNNHRIKQLVSELQFDNTSKATELYETIRELLYGRLHNVLEQCFDEFSLQNEIIQFKTLVLDLGHIAYDDLPWLMEIRLREALHEALTGACMDVSTEGPEIKKAQQKNIESLEHFLLKGYLPWNAEADALSLFRRCLRENPKEVADSLRKTGVSSVVRARLIERFDNIFLGRIAHSLEPQYGQVIVEYHRHLSRINSEEDIVRTARTALEKTLWLFIFNYLLLEQSSFFNTKDFVKSTLCQFASTFNISFLSLITLLVKGLKKWEGAGHPLLMTVLKEISTEFSVDSMQRTHNAIHHSPIETLSTLQEYLRSGSITKKLSSDKRKMLTISLSQLLTDHPHETIECLRSIRKQPEAIRRLIGDFGKEIPLKLVKTLEPGDFETILEYHKNVVTLHKNEPFTTSSQKVLEQSLWELVVVNLLENHGSYFNQKAFLKTLIYDTALHHNLGFHELLSKMYSSAKSLPTRASRINTFFRLVEEIYCDTNDDHQALAAPVKETTSNNESALQHKFDDILQCWAANKPHELKEKARQVLLNFFTLQPDRAISILKKYAGHSMIRAAFLQTLHDKDFLKIIKAVMSIQYEMIHGLWQLSLGVKKDIQHYYNNQKSFAIAVKGGLFDVLLLNLSSRPPQNQVVVDYFIDSIVREGNGLTRSKLIGLFNKTKKIPKSLKALLKLLQTNQEVLPAHTAVKVTDLLQWVLKVPRNDYSSYHIRGFLNFTEALQHVLLYKKKEFMRIAMRTGRSRLSAFIDQLTNDELDLLLKESKEKENEQWVLLLHRLGHILKGLYQFEEIMQALKRITLRQQLTGWTLHQDIFLAQLASVFEKYSIPASLFKQEHDNWSLPTHGNTTDAINRMERLVVNPYTLKQSPHRKPKIVTLLKEIVNGIPKNKLVKADQAHEKKGEEIFINNAGLVLLHPYLNYLFTHCGYFEDGKFKSPLFAQRAVALLHYACFGNVKYAEEDLVLNKVLCGLDSTTVVKPIRLKKPEKELAGQMLDAIISHWEIVKNSSHEGFRGAWLLREGKLKDTEEYWELTVEQKTYDILLEQLPFTLSPAKLSWVDKMIKINWR